ncbi:MAG: hypothetical protein JSR82_11625 [Verrucomicrobia bacterium]|nr:hypothetical protein [Verrucomicrobiota bacterium]
MSPRRLCLALLFATASLTASAADPAAELASFSAFPTVDLAALGKGEVKTQRSGSSGRTLAVQSVYAVAGTPAETAEALRRFNPQRYSDLKVYLHAEFSGSPSAATFSALRNPPNNSPVQAWIKQTNAKASTLQLTAADLAKAPSEASASAVGGFWAEVLAKRAAEFASGGIGRVAAYETSGTRPAAELAAMLGAQDKLKSRFGSLISSTVESGGGRPTLSWDLSDADDEAIVSLGAFYVRPQAGGAVQAVDCGFYASGGYFASLTLFQMWPVEIDGKPSTLVFRADLVSSAQLANLRGVERLGAESLMQKKIKRSIALTRGK